METVNLPAASYPTQPAHSPGHELPANSPRRCKYDLLFAFI